MHALPRSEHSPYAKKEAVMSAVTNRSADGDRPKNRADYQRRSRIARYPRPIGHLVEGANVKFAIEVQPISEQRREPFQLPQISRRKDRVLVRKNLIRSISRKEHRPAQRKHRYTHCVIPVCSPSAGGEVKRVHVV